MLFAVFDTETTGLPFHPQAPIDKQPRIIEFAGLITDGDAILATLEFICNPGIAIEAIITEITGLKNEDLAGKPPFSSFVGDVFDYFAQAEGRIAHNLSFDKGMLQFDLKRIGKSLDDINWFTPTSGKPAVEICTVEQTYHEYGKRQRLQDLYNELIGKYVQKHRALDDVKLLHEVCKKIGVYEAFKEVA
jgi:DNA polymerase III epsilon subunit-like protein